MSAGRVPPEAQPPSHLSSRTPALLRSKAAASDDDLFSERPPRLTDGSDSSVMMRDDDMLSGAAGVRADSASTSDLSDVFASATKGAPPGSRG